MSMSIRTNIGSLNAQRNLTANQNSLSSTLSKLSSGYRITKAGDDAAGLAISEKLRAQVGGLNQAIRNSNDAISMIQTAEGGMQEIHSMLQRMNQLATQAANGALSDENRANINAELQALKAEINSIADRTKFNGEALLNGSFGASLDAGNSDIKVGVTAGNAVISKVDVGSAKAGTFTFAADGDKLTLTDANGISQTLTVGGVAANGTGTLDFSQFGIKIDLVAGTAETAANIAAAFDGKGLAVTGAGAAQFQIGANAADTLSVNFESVKIEAGGAFDALNSALNAFNAVGGQTVANANDMIDAVGAAIDKVSELRSNLGAAQNRLDHTIANLGITAENLSASEAQIRDADIAEETAAMSKAQVLLQAGISVLAQANQQPQMALKLLG